MKRNNFFSPSTLARRVSVAALSIFALALAACGSDPTGGGSGSGSGSGSDTGTTEEVDKIVEWMDKRLQKEYYWMEEYNQKRSTFDMTVEWDKYLGISLAKMTTNTDDGSGSGSNRYLYTYVQRKKVGSAAATMTRAEYPVESGFGIDLASYVVDVAGVDKYVEGNYGLPINHVYPSSTADALGIKRGDVIMEVNGSRILRSNYSTLWSNIGAAEQSMELTIYGYNEEIDDYELLDYSLTVGSYEANPIAYGDLLTIDKDVFDVGDKKIGYLCYLSFDADFDQKMVEAVTNLVEKGATDVILDLRSNSGGHVSSSILLSSMLLDESYVGPGKIYARIKHNPNNKVYDDEEYTLQKRYTPNGSSTSVDLPNLGLSKVWIICSEDSASASEMVIVGLRGLDVEVELVGNTTEGKNCGMEVTYKTLDGYKYSFAPITFMNENGKGFSDYGDGIIPEHHLYEKASDTSLSEYLRGKCAYFPIPVTTWGDVEDDIALRETVMQICGKSLFDKTPEAITTYATRSASAPMPKRTALKMEKQDLNSQGMFILQQDVE